MENENESRKKDKDSTVFSSDFFGGKIKLERRRNDVSITCIQSDEICLCIFFGGKIKIEEGRRKVCKLCYLFRRCVFSDRNRSCRGLHLSRRQVQRRHCNSLGRTDFAIAHLLMHPVNSKLKSKMTLSVSNKTNHQ